MQINKLKKRAEKALFFLKFSNLLLKVGDKVILEGANLEIEYDNIVLLKGRVGSGKSTILKMLGGLVNVKEGSFSLRNSKGEALSPIYIHSQAEFNFVTGLIDDELKFAGLERIEEFKGRSVYELSGGELKRLAIIMAMKYEYADCLLIDEPLDMLDDKQSNVIAEIIIEISKFKPIIIATHDDNFDEIADIIISI